MKKGQEREVGQTATKGSGGRLSYDEDGEGEWRFTGKEAEEDQEKRGKSDWCPII